MADAKTDALAEAQRLYQESLDALADQRKQIEEDLRFSDPSDPQQWEEDVKAQRENDPGGKRPCLVMDQTGQYTAQVTGQIEKQPPSLHAIPVGGAADKKAAEQIDGRFRHIEHASRATQHYARALTSAARAGVGYMVVRPEYVDRALGWQEPRIGSEPDPLKVVLDPWSTETDGKDADFGFILSDMSERSFKRRWPKADLVDFGDTETKRADDRKNVLVAECWQREWVQTDMIVYMDERGQETSGRADEVEAITERLAQAQMPLQVVREYSDKMARIWWRRMNGAEVLEESEYLADSIGIVPVYGYVGFADGRMRYCGIPRRARKPQQAYNYHKSELMMPGAQLIASKRAMAGVESLWDNAHTQRRAVLPYVDQDEDGPVSQPTLIKTGSSLVDHFAGAESALRDLQAAIGMYQANLGAPSNETSGVAIESRKEQGENSTAHFPSHMAASLGQVGAIVMQMDARLADTRRTMPIMGIDGSPGQITVDPASTKAFQRLPNGGGVVINPNLGKYAVRVVVGASYSTQRSQTNAAFAEIMRGNKELAPTVAPFWANTLDFPGSDKFAQAMAAMAPPPVKALLQPEGADDELDPADLAQQLAQCKVALQEATQLAQEAQADADEAMREADIQKTKAMARAKELEIEEYKAETDRLKVTGANAEQIQAITSQLVGEMMEGAMPQVQALAMQSAEQGATGVLTAAQQAAEQERLAREAQEQEGADMDKQLAEALLQGQQALQQRMQQLIQLVAMERERIPERGPDGSITRVLDRMVQPAAPMQQ